MSGGPRVTATPAEKTGNVVRDSALGLVPETLDHYLNLQQAVWTGGPMTPAELEMMRLRNAAHVGCVFCKAVRYDIATEAGLTEAKLSAMGSAEAASELSEREQLIVRFTDAYLNDPCHLSAVEQALMAEQFTAEELAHMSMALILFNTFSRFAVSMGGMPDADLPLMTMSVPQ